MFNLYVSSSLTRWGQRAVYERPLLLERLPCMRACVMPVPGICSSCIYTYSKINGNLLVAACSCFILSTGTRLLFTRYQHFCFDREVKKKRRRTKEIDELSATRCKVQCRGAHRHLMPLFNLFFIPRRQRTRCLRKLLRRQVRASVRLHRGHEAKRA